MAINIKSRIQTAYAKHKRTIEARAKRGMEAAQTQYEKERIEQEKQLALLQLERKMYETKAAVIREREAVATARKAAGVQTFGERVQGIVQGFVDVGVSLYKGYRSTSPKPKRRKSGTRKVAKRRTTRK